MKKRLFKGIITAAIAGSLLPVSVMSAGAAAIKGDANRDGTFSIADVVLLQKYLLGAAKDNFPDPEGADLCKDGRLDVFDMCLMKKLLVGDSLDVDIDVTVDQLFGDFTDEIYKTGMLSDGGNDSAKVITSVNELEEYLSVYFGQETVQKYLEKYDESYFEKNTLLLNSLCQTRGKQFTFSVNGLERSEGSFQVSAKWNVKAEYPDAGTSALLVQISVPYIPYSDVSAVWNIETEVTAPSLILSKQIDVQNILQNPELPTGCECVSLTMVLNHLGFDVDKLTLAREHLPKMDFYWSDGTYYGADFRTTFAGDPESYDSYGCYAPCIKATADSYFSENGYSSTACDITGTDLDTLFTDYINKDIPVLIWITSGNLHESALTSIWTTPDGETVQWRAYEHCVVLTGYDRVAGLVYVSDPLYGNISYDYFRLKQRYIELGQQALYIQE